MNFIKKTKNKQFIIVPLFSHIKWVENYSFFLFFFCNNTGEAPKVIPPIYFHGNYNRYKKYNNTEHVLNYKTLFSHMFINIGLFAND